MKKLLFYIFIPVLAFLLMSHNTSALELTQDVDSVYSWKNPKIWCMVFGGSLYSNGSDTCIVGPNTGTAWQGRGVSYIKTANINLVANDYYQIFLDVSTSGGAEKQIPVMWNLGTTANYDIVSFRMVSDSNNIGSSADNEIYVATYEIILKGLYNNSSFPIELGYPAGNINMLYLGGDFNTNNMDVRISRINQYHPRGALSNSDVVNAINNQSQQEQNAANNIQNQSPSDIGNSTNAQTQSLLDTFGSFVSAIASISPSNCNVDFDLGHIDFGKQNLCSVDLPNVFTGVTSIIVIMFTIPFVYHLVNRILGLIREMQT